MRFVRRRPRRLFAVLSLHLSFHSSCPFTAAVFLLSFHCSCPFTVLSTKEMMQPCLVYLHAISLNARWGAQVTHVSLNTGIQERLGAPIQTFPRL